MGDTNKPSNSDAGAASQSGSAGAALLARRHYLGRGTTSVGGRVVFRDDASRSEDF
jgi:hypothetical protein